MRRPLAVAALFLAVCFERHHPLSGFVPKDDKDPQPTLRAMVQASEIPPVEPCEGKGGSRYLRFHDQRGVELRQWVYQVETGGLVWIEEHPWEGTPCPCVDMVLPLGDEWARRPKMTCGAEISHPTPADLRQFAPEALGTSP